MLYIIGIGLFDEKDITVRGLEAIKSCDLIFLEHYTAILQVDTNKIEELYGKKVIVADRDLVETDAEQILEENSEFLKKNHSNCLNVSLYPKLLTSNPNASISSNDSKNTISSFLPNI